MESKNKDKLIIGLIIIIAVLFANNIFKDSKDDYFSDRLSLISSDDDLTIEPSETNLTDVEDISEIKVHIAGEVNNEGVYTIKEGDRLEDIIKLAGGLTPYANDKDLNLAMKLEDQMKIYIPNINEVISPESNLPLVNIDSPSNDAGKIDINTADKATLMTLPNIGEKRADAIIEYRQLNSFNSIEDIKNVTGIGDKYFEAMEDQITVR